MELKVGDEVVYKGRRATVEAVDGNFCLIHIYEINSKLWVESRYCNRTDTKLDDDIELDISHGKR